MRDVGLSDTVMALQRLDLTPETRQVVEEAARLLQDERDMEARALVEKAEALVVRGTHGAPKVNGSSTGVAALMIAPLAEKLAAGFTGVLTGVLQEVYQYTGDQVRVVAGQLEERIHGIEAAVRTASGLEERLERLAAEHRERLEALRRSQEETSGAVRILQQAALDARVRAVEERVGALEQLTHEMEPQLAGALARLDRHTEALQWLEQRQAQRVTALNQFLDTVAQLKEPEPYRRDARAATA